MTYLLLAALWTVATFLGFAIEVTSGNIRHVENGREPNAGAALFPNIPCVPLLFVGLAWLLDQVYPMLGFWTCVVLFCLFVVSWWFWRRKLNAQLQDLIAARERG